jgi:transitional endoplasmic reticulum ATPase
LTLSGLLLHGPPGSGKSTVAELLALRCNAALLRVDAASILSRYLGDSEAKIKAFVEVAAAYDGPCIVLIDEIDGLFPAGAGSTMNTIQRAFQTAVEPARLAKAKVVIVGTTNYLDRIPAPIQDRLERVVEISAPKPEVYQQALRLKLDKHAKGHVVTDGEVASLAAAIAKVGFRKLGTIINSANNEAVADRQPLAGCHLSQAVADLLPGAQQPAAAVAEQEAPAVATEQQPAVEQQQPAVEQQQPAVEQQQPAVEQQQPAVERQPE